MDSILDRFLLLGGPKTGSLPLRFGLYFTICICAPEQSHQEAPRGLQTPDSDTDLPPKSAISEVDQVTIGAIRAV